jgi:hypothetical protein
LPLIDKLAAVPGIAHVEPDYFAGIFARVPDDPRFSEQWGLHNTGQTGGEPDADVDAPEAWDHETGGDVLVGMLDTGVDTNHEDLWEKLELDDAWDFINDDPDPEDDHGHGTATTSVAAASTDNAIGMAGTCWACRILPIKAFDDTASGTYSTMADSFIWATDHGARVINMSAGKYSSSDILLRAVAYSADAGTIITAAVGNSQWSPGYPARYRESIAVGGTEDDDTLYSLSNRGSEVDVVAPAVSILSADMGGGYNHWTGTSFAAPRVAGAAGILRTVYPSIGREDALHLICASAEDEVGDPSEDTPGFDIYHGWGRLNIDRSVRGALSAISLRVEGQDSTRLFLDTPNPLADSYDFVRGEVADLRETSVGVELTSLTCIENDSADPDTSGSEDAETPSPGSAFYYLARFNAAPGAGSYGGSTQNRDRRVLLQPDWEAFGGQADAWFGHSTSSAGDVNNDGYDDVVVGAYQYDAAEIDAGRAEVYLGGPSGLASTPIWSAEGDTEGAGFGFSVGSAGDVNGDGYDDIIVSAYQRVGELYDDEGRVYVYHGSATGPESSPAWTVDGGQASGQFGISVNGAGDVNADGFDDVIIGAQNYDVDSDSTSEGMIWVYHGSASGLSDTPAWTMEGEQADAKLGRRVASAGDVNADGFGDVLIGANRYDGPELDEGRAWVFLGGPDGLDTAPNAVLEIDQAYARHGTSGGGAGDVNADGYDDVIVGAVRYTNGETYEGGAFLYYGSAAGVETSYSWSFESNQHHANVGKSNSVNGAGDVNGDGTADVVIGGWYYDETRTDEGRAWVFYGSPSGLSAAPDWSTPGLYTEACLGLSSAAAGDTDGDGVGDLLLGSHTHDEDYPDEGRALAFYGPLPANTDCPQ